MRSRWIPGPLRSRVPELLRARYAVWGAPVPGDVAERLRAALPPSLEVTGSDPAGVPSTLLWHTRAAVYGVIRRRIAERVELLVQPGPPAALELRCAPQAHHEAHAAGFAGVLALAACGILVGPQAFGSILLGGSFVAAYARELEMVGLERRLRHLLELLGSAVWPRVPAQIALSREIVR